MPISMQTDDGEVYLTYGVSGARNVKNFYNGTDTTKVRFYYYDGGTLLYETIGTIVSTEEDTEIVEELIQYVIDEAGSHIGFIHNGTEYYFAKNLQGDVQRIYKADGTLVGEYHYDAWGNILNEDSLTAIAQLNPIRYRSYYYDSETGLYYLNSRYYDPETGRFINSDDAAYLGADGIVTGYNLFAYCTNNPVNGFDPTGRFFISITACIAIGSVVVGVLAFSHTAAVSYKYTGSVDWLGATFNGLCWGMTVYTMGMSIYGIYCDYSYSKGKEPVTGIGTSQTTQNYPPNNGFNAEPRNSTLSSGSTLQRSGGEQGKYVAPANTPVEKLSLPPDKINAPITNYTVLKPIQVQAGTAMPWFGQPGGGTQFLLPDTISNLQRNGYIAMLPK